MDRVDNHAMGPSFVSIAALALAASAGRSTVASSLRAEFAPSGTLRVGVNYGNPVVAQKDPAGGEPRGVGPSLARELARRIGVPVSYVAYDTAGKMADAVRDGAWDIAFLAVDPKRANEIDFSAPYMEIEGTYLVPKNSPLRTIADVDREGIRIAVAENSAYDLFLGRNLNKAKLVKFPTSIAAIEQFRARSLDAAGGVKNPLADAAAKDPTLRVIDGRFMVIGQASGVPKGRATAGDYLRAFIEEMKASGFVARALKESGAEAEVAPAAR